MLLGTWKGIKLENTTIDSFFIKSQHLIDTVGKKNTPDENYEFYGTSNIDSVRQVLQMQHDSAKVIEFNKVYKTIFQFKNNKMAYISFDDNISIDTAKWNFDDEGSLILEDLSQSGERRLLRFSILDINDTIMQLKIIENNDSSKITFRHFSD